MRVNRVKVDFSLLPCPHPPNALRRSLTRDTVSPISRSPTALERFVRKETPFGPWMRESQRRGVCRAARLPGPEGDSRLPGAGSGSLETAAVHRGSGAITHIIRINKSMSSFLLPAAGKPRPD